jgi:hypothetical protein
MKHFVSRLSTMLETSPWIQVALAGWTLLMLGVVLLVIAGALASQPLPKVAAVGEVRPPEPVHPPPTPLIERVTFRERWSPVQLPALPATLVTPVTLAAPPPMLPAPVALLPQPGIEPGTPVRIIPRKVERKAGTCERHGLRKVWVSDRRWRCRR